MYKGFSEVGPMTEEAENACRVRNLNYYDVEYALKSVQGKILTLVEASHSDKEQRKATKDIVNQLFSSQMVEQYNCALNMANRGDGSAT